MKSNDHEPHYDMAEVDVLTQRIGELADGERAVDVALACSRVMTVAILSMKSTVRAEAADLIFRLVHRAIEEGQ